LHRPVVESMVKLSAGFSLYFPCEVKGKRDPNKPVVILLQGFINPSLSWWYYKQKLLEDNYEVCTYDRSGIGFSEPSNIEWITVQTFLEEIREVLIKTKKVEVPHVIVGFSLGAALTGRYVEQYPNEPFLKGAYIIDPPILTTPTNNAKETFAEFGLFFTIGRIFAENGLFRPLWYFGLMNPLGFFGDGIPKESIEPYYYLAAKPNGYYTGLLNELRIVTEPGHGHFFNVSTVEFVAKYNKIPIKVELRESCFIFTRNTPLDQEWRDTRQTLKEYFKEKQESFKEDHLGSINAEEKPHQSINRLYPRLQSFLKTIKI